MKETRITLPELMLVAGTRGILGAGIGLLLADRLSDGQRKGAGWALMLIGAPIPLALEVFGGRGVPFHCELDQHDDVRDWQRA